MIGKLTNLLITLFGILTRRRWKRRLQFGEDIILGKELNDRLIAITTEENIKLNSNLYSVVSGPNPEWLDVFSKSFVLEGSFYTEHKNAFLIGFCAVAIDSRGNVLLDSTLGSKGYLDKTGDSKFIQSFERLETEKNIEVVFSLVNVLSKSYFHWVSEVLPMLRSYFEYGRINGQLPTIIIDSSPTEFQLQFLDLMGVPKDKVLFWEYKKIRANKLVLSSLNFLRIKVDDFNAWHLYSKCGLNWLAERFERSREVKKDQRIYVSRRESRVVINEEELVYFLKKRNVKQVFLEDLSVADQIDLFKRAALIISVHGAGLVNLIFSRGIKVIELFPDERNTYLTYHYFQISNYFDHDYTLCYCKTQNNDHDIVVDLDLLNQLLGDV